MLMTTTLWLATLVLLQPADEAAKYFQAEDWTHAAEAYQKAVETDPENGRAWARLGISLTGLSRYDEAIQALERAEGLGFIPPLSRFYLARVEALSGDAAGAFERLQSALDAGFSGVGQLESEPAFAALKSDPRYAAVLDGARRNAAPCEYAPEFRQFDFWIGEWDVTSLGQKAGENRVEKYANGCFLLENWTSVSGGSGHSMNFYDGANEKWHQIWVDSGGTSIIVEGGLRDDGAMHFEGEHLYPNGTRQLYKMTFTPNEDGTVRQYIEQSQDGGKTWSVWFDGLYARKTSE